MPHEPVSLSPERVPVYSRPWSLLAAGLACFLLAWLLPTALAVPAPVRVTLLFAGCLASMAAVVHRLRQTSWDLPQRFESAALVSGAGLGALLGFLAVDKAWDSGALFFTALFLLAIVGAILILLPPLLRRIALSVLILFHFGGMAVAITSVDPPNSVGPWLSKQLWTRVYRPYLSFMYLSNAYHFYSPDPGPASLFWFAVQYSDGSYAWVKFPDRDYSPIGMHYQRLLALPEHSFSPIPGLPPSAALLQGLEPDKIPERGSWEEIYHRRELGSTLKFRPKGLPIPMVDIDVNQQYREPHDGSKKILASVATRILENAPPGPAGTTADSVKMYRVVHQILSPAELAKGVSPWDKTKYLPFFLGEFDREGRLKDSHEPFLYWFLPIVMVPDDYPNNGAEFRPGVPAASVRFPPKTGFLLNCLELHAAGPMKNPQEKK